MSVLPLLCSPLGSIILHCCLPQVHVFDVSENTAKALHSQKVSRKGYLNRIDFNPKYPIVVVGDDKYVRVMKYSTRCVCTYPQYQTKFMSARQCSIEVTCVQKTMRVHDCNTQINCVFAFNP